MANLNGISQPKIPLTTCDRKGIIAYIGWHRLAGVFLHKFMLSDF